VSVVVFHTAMSIALDGFARRLRVSRRRLVGGVQLGLLGPILARDRVTAMADFEGSNDRLRGDEATPSAVRLTFVFEGDRLALESRQEVDMTPLPSDTDLEEAPERERVAELGFRIDLVNTDGRVLYRRAARHLIPESLEMPTGDVERPLARQAVDQAEGSFDVVVPIVEGAQEAVLYRGPREQQVLRGAVEPVFREVIRVPLRSPGS
jgi:hypothetical protein